MADLTRLDDQAVARRLARVDELLEQIDGVPGPTAEAAIEAVQALTELYGEALARVLDGAGTKHAHALAQDDLIGHLLVLHGLHPEPVEQRVAHAIDGVRPVVRKKGGDVALEDISGGVARVRLTARGCGVSSGALEEAVREAVLALAPELTDVQALPQAQREAAFVPLDALMGPHAAAGRPA